MATPISGVGAQVRQWSLVTYVDTYSSGILMELLQLLSFSLSSYGAVLFFSLTTSLTITPGKVP